MTIASQHAKATHVSERLGWLIDHSMLSCRHLCVCVSVIKAIHLFFFVHWPSSPSFDRRHKKKQEVKEYVPARISMSTMCVCVYWWERRTHLIRVRIEMNQQNHFFWHVCLLEKINIWFYPFFLFFYSHRSLNLIEKNGRKPISVGHRVIRALNKMSRNICAYFFFSSSNHPSNLFRLRLRSHMHTHTRIYIYTHKT